MMINMQQFEAAVRFVAENNPHYTKTYKERFITEGSDTRTYSQMSELEQRGVRNFP